jgi:hypothetical protein
VISLDAESFAYPHELLAGCRSGLLLFASGRAGAADGHWFREAGIASVTAVDWDEQTLDAMQDLYPRCWSFLRCDAFEFARDAAARGRRWDVVSADAPSQYAPELVARLPIWCALASRFVTATLFRHCFAGEPLLRELPAPPEGWRWRELRWRAAFRGGVYWLIGERVRS